MIKISLSCCKQRGRITPPCLQHQVTVDDRRGNGIDESRLGKPHLLGRLAHDLRCPSRNANRIVIYFDNRKKRIAIREDATKHRMLSLVRLAEGLMVICTPRPIIAHRVEAIVIHALSLLEAIDVLVSADGQQHALRGIAQNATKCLGSATEAFSAS